MSWYDAFYILLSNLSIDQELDTQEEIIVVKNNQHQAIKDANHEKTYCLTPLEMEQHPWSSYKLCGIRYNDLIAYPLTIAVTMSC